MLLGLVLGGDDDGEPRNGAGGSVSAAMGWLLPSAPPSSPASRRGARASSRLGRSERIRTSDPLLPKQVRYQAALHSDTGALFNALGRAVQRAFAAAAQAASRVRCPARAPSPGSGRPPRRPLLGARGRAAGLFACGWPQGADAKIGHGGRVRRRAKPGVVVGDVDRPERVLQRLPGEEAVAGGEAPRHALRERRRRARERRGRRDRPRSRRGRRSARQKARASALPGNSPDPLHVGEEGADVAEAPAVELQPVAVEVVVARRARPAAARCRPGGSGSAARRGRRCRRAARRGRTAPRPAPCSRRGSGRSRRKSSMSQSAVAPTPLAPVVTMVSGSGPGASRISPRRAAGRRWRGRPRRSR